MKKLWKRRANLILARALIEKRWIACDVFRGDFFGNSLVYREE